jgi:hypothetical protein
VYLKLALLYCVTLLPASAQTDLNTLLNRLSERPLSAWILFRIEEYPVEPRTLTSLKAAFNDDENKQERQYIAATLIRLGEQSNEYFDFLAGFAKVAVEDRSPFFLNYDAAGRSIRGEFNPEFERWCIENHKNPREIAALQFGTYSRDIEALATAEDRRALEIFRTGLGSGNPLVIAYSVAGLGRLQDINSLPLISAALDHAQAGDRRLIATHLAWYSHPAAERLLSHIVPDASTRDTLRRDIELLRIDELNIRRTRALRSLGK